MSFGFNDIFCKCIDTILHSATLQISLNGPLPLNYISIQTFKGKSNSCHLQPIADKIKSNLSAQNASLLSMPIMVQLLKCVIQSILTHSITVYSWSISLLIDLQKWLENFTWSEDIIERKLVTISCKKIYKPCEKGDLGLMFLMNLNDASNLKLCC